MRGNVHFGRSSIPWPAVVGFPLSWIVWLLALGTHRAGRVVPPLWLLGGVIVFVIVRRRAGLPIFGRMSSVELELPEFAEVPYGTIIVPVKQAGPDRGRDARDRLQARPARAAPGCSRSR